MARLPGGHEVLEKAKELLTKAKEADDLRVLQAVVFPLAYGLTTQETAIAIGRSVRWTTKARNGFIRSGGLLQKPSNKTRNRAHMSKEEERAFLAPFFGNAVQGGVLVVSGIHEALEEHMGRRISLASVYKLLHRNGWRKLAPDKRN
ncbi:MAG: winged helix-turn-helix domain-containing protein [Holophagales bacterium]|jgi:transposase|nr:winged helix-turn-helix domain-containing protein [Holophagales bacterium]